MRVYIHTYIRMCVLVYMHINALTHSEDQAVDMTGNSSDTGLSLAHRDIFELQLIHGDWQTGFQTQTCLPLGFVKSCVGALAA